VTDVLEAVLRGHAVGPSLDGGALHLHCPATFAAHQMMVMPGAAAAVDSFTIHAAQHVDLARVGQRLERPVDSCETNSRAALTQHRVQLLSAAKIRQVVEYGGDSGSLPSRP
jgi:hypothetical protein